MSLRLDPHGSTGEKRREARSPDDAEKRVFPRIRCKKYIELRVGSETYEGETYDISQGGLSFFAVDTLPLGHASIKILNTRFIFEGKILASHNAVKAKHFRFHLAFLSPLNLVTLAGIVGS